MNRFPVKTKNWEIQAAWAEWHLRRKNEIPDQEAIVKRKYRQFQNSLKDRWPAPHTKKGKELAVLIRERKYLENQLEGKLSAWETRGKLRELKRKIESYIIVASPDEIARREQEWLIEKAKLDKLYELPEILRRR